MDRALDPEKLASALGNHARLPSPTELRQFLADTEIALFTRQAEIGEGLLDAAWYLQSVATARADLQAFPVERRRLAHQVSAHVFDLFLQSASLSEDERLRYTFAAQIGYVGGAQTPNATAIARRAPVAAAPYEWTEPGRVSLEAGVQLLALNRPSLYPLLQARRAQLNQFAERMGDLSESAYAAVNGVIRAVWELTNYLTYGREETLESATSWLRTALENESSADDVDSRWVAAHLLNISEELASASVWSVLPSDYSDAARAMTLGDPPVMVLWPPQLSFLEVEGGGLSPLDPEVRRLVLSFPTSAGKSLLAQIFVLTHLIAANSDVCVVAPTHSLCRELSVGLERRLRTMGYVVHEEGPIGLIDARPASARVVVMTPEKLAARLRSDPSSLLDEFGMFIFDEAHLVSDQDRGWKLEETITLLNHLTRASDHRILILSAALGNASHIVAWLDHGSEVVSRHESWRGPRRLNVVFSAERDSDRVEDEPAEGRRQARRVFPLKGILRLRTGVGDLVRAQFREPIGVQVRRQQRDGGWTQDRDRSTRQRDQLVPLVVHVATSGPVLVVEATRTEAQNLAETIADRFSEEDSAPFALIDTIRSRLGPNHRLTRVLSRGVAFHHSALPIDVQTEIEDAVRRGEIGCLISTTTLTEGVNLPFKTVIVAHRGYRGRDGELVELIDAPRLLNAVGRAGRAGRETEGWLILSQLGEAFNDSMLGELERSGADIELRSTLANDSAVEALARVEAAHNAGEDAILSNSEAAAEGFISFVWFVASALEELRGAVTAQVIIDVIRDTLAWHQLDEAARGQLQRVAGIAFEVYSGQSPDRRKRWARTGTSLPSAVVLDNVSDEVLQACQAHTEPRDLADSVDLIVGDGRLMTLLHLTENRRRGFKLRRNAPRDALVDVDLQGLLRGWLSGSEVEELGDQYLSMISSEDYRYEQLHEFIASVFEHHLPWTFGIIVGWVNNALEEAGSLQRLPADLPGVTHFGVASSDALALMLGGIRSRRLANRVASAYEHIQTDDRPTLRQWLAGQDIGRWRDQFEASPTELLDILAYTRVPEAMLVSEVLAGNGYSVPIELRARVMDGAEARIEHMVGDLRPAPLAVIVDGSVVGIIQPQHHEDVAFLRDIGIPLSVHITLDGTQASLDLRLADQHS